MKKEKYFTEYDIEHNPDNYTDEELITIRRMMSSGEAIYPTPIVIEDESQLEALHISRAQCQYWRTGKEIHLVHLTPASAEIYQYVIKDLEKDRRTAYRYHRCLIPGEKKTLRHCPDNIHCDKCPYGRQNETKQANFISLDALMKGDEPIDNTADSVLEKIIQREEYHQICENLRERNTKFLHSLILHSFYGYGAAEIAKMLDDTPRNIYYYLDEAKKIVREYKDKA